MTFAQKLVSKHSGAILSFATILPILAACWPILVSGNSFPSGDFDMQVQMTEAAKISIIEYGQFPSWNPWVNGGVPLFADPQFGLPTPQTLISFFTSSAMAWKITFVCYLIVGFFAMKALVRYLLSLFLGSKETASTIMLSILLGYIWVFNSFFWSRFNGGHLTFITLLLLPLGIYLVATFNRTKARCYQTVLFFTFLLYAALHYPTIFTIITVSAISFLLLVVELTEKVLRREPLRGRLFSLESSQRVIFLCATLFVSILLALPRIYTSLKYIITADANRSFEQENFFGIWSGLDALFSPFGSYTTPLATYGPFEATNYLGPPTAIGCTLLLLVCAYIHKKDMHRKLMRKGSTYIASFAVLGIAAFLIGLGGAVFKVLQQLPAFSMMRVSTRYFLITALCILVMIALLFGYASLSKSFRSPRVTAAFLLLLLLSIPLQVRSNTEWASRQWNKNTTLDTTSMGIARSSKNLPPEPVQDWHIDHTRAQFSVTKATVHHKTQLITDNALTPTASIGTQRCESASCDFIISKNASVLSWSPNSITLHKTGDGPVELNMNPGRGWRLNNKKLTLTRKSVDTHTLFLLPAGGDTNITLTHHPL